MELVQVSDQPTKFELYSVFVGTITAAEQRRQQISSIYYSILMAVAAFLGSNIEVDIVYIILPLSLISFIFFAKIRYFRNLASAKFEVIQSLENEWDIKPFDIEWQAFKKQKKLRLGGLLTHLEAAIPFIIAVSGIIYSIYIITPRILNSWCGI